MKLPAILRRVGFVAVATVLAFLAGQQAYKSYWRSLDPGAAPRAVADDPMLRLRQFEKIAEQPDQFSAQADAIAANALAVLRTEPLQAAAIRQLGMAIAATRRGTAEQHFALAERLTRRDVITQLQLIDQASRDDDIPLAVAHYDRLLQAYPAASEYLFPVLAKALPDLDVRAALGTYIARPWALNLLTNAVDLGGDPASVTEVMADLNRQMAPKDRERLTSAIIRQLLTRGQFALVSDLLKSSPGGVPASLDQIAMTAPTSDPKLAQLAWIFVNDDAVQSALDSGGRLTVRVASEKSGMVAERITMLAPGSYRLGQTVAFEAGTPPARLRWMVSCLAGTSSRLIWEQALPVGQDQASYQSALAVPAACAGQKWQLYASGDTSQFESAASLSDLALARP